MIGRILKTLTVIFLLLFLACIPTINIIEYIAINSLIEFDNYSIVLLRLTWFMFICNYSFIITYVVGWSRHTFMRSNSDDTLADYISNKELEKGRKDIIMVKALSYDTEFRANTFYSSIILIILGTIISIMYLISINLTVLNNGFNSDNIFLGNGFERSIAVNISAFLASLFLIVNRLGKLKKYK